MSWQLSVFSYYFCGGNKSTAFSSLNDDVSMILVCFYGRNREKITGSEVLLSKHPVPSQPPESALEDYDTLPALINLDVTDDVVQRVTTQMQGAAGPGGVDSMALQDWLLHFGEASCKLCEAVASIACWLANTHPA
eukprot:15351107-Ditylum_brightwellii.AAC.1